MSLGPIRMIRTCQHSFHAACLDEWLTLRAECPLCRGELPSYATKAKEHAFLEQVRNLVQLLERDIELTRSIITFAAVMELLERYPRALGGGGLREATEQIQRWIDGLLVNGVRPSSIALESRYALQAQARELRRTLAEQLGCQAANVHRQERVKRVREVIRPLIGRVL